MKRIVMFVLGVMMISIGALAQAPDAAIETALLAAPANMHDGAAVIKWKADFTYETLRKGTNRLGWYQRPGRQKHQPFAIECTSITNLDRVAQNLKFEAVGDKVKTQALLDAAEKDGTRVKPEYGSVWYHMLGPDREHANIHMTIAVPGATTQTLGLTDNNKAGTVWIMNAGTSTAHLMTPGA